MIGNYGVPDDERSGGISVHFESEKIQCLALVIADYSEKYSHWDSSRSLGTWLKQNGVDRMPFAVNNSAYDEAVQEFVRLRRENALPPAMPVVRYVKQQEEQKTETLEDRARNLFGDMLEIAEGE